MMSVYDVGIWCHNAVTKNFPYATEISSSVPSVYNMTDMNTGQELVWSLQPNISHSKVDTTPVTADRLHSPSIVQLDLTANRWT